MGSGTKGAGPHFRWLGPGVLYLSLPLDS